VGCGGARGALGCGRGAAEVANGGEQNCGGALATVVERRRKRGSERRPREEGKEVEEGSWTRCKTKRSHGRAGSRWRPAARRGGFGRRRCDMAMRGKRQLGQASGGRVSWRPGGAGRAVRGQLVAKEFASAGAAGGRSNETEREGREEDDEDLSEIFQKARGSW
jgi:hypothetical protein